MNGKIFLKNLITGRKKYRKIKVLILKQNDNEKFLNV